MRNKEEIMVKLKKRVIKIKELLKDNKKYQ
jgi:hypothetical protein